MKIIWAEDAWEDYLFWQKQDIRQQPFQGLGNPEPLKHNWQGFWSRSIDLEHRLVYQISEDSLFIAQCRYHY